MPSRGVKGKPLPGVGVSPKASLSDLRTQGIEVDTDLGNANRFVELCAETLRYVPLWEAWVYYEGGYWHRDNTKGTHARRAALAVAKTLRREARTADERAWAKRSQAEARIQAMIKLASADPRIELLHTAFDRNHFLLNVQNGTLDLETGKLRPHAKEDFITKISRATFNPKAASKRWAAALQTSLPDPVVRDYVQRFLGYCLTGDVGERIVVMFVGKGRNGKSLIARVVQELMGPYATTLASTVLMSSDKEQHPTEVADLFGARLAVMSEIKRGRAIDEEKFKRLSGNDELKARRMREDFWAFSPTHKSLFLVNHRPHVGRDPAVWDRVAIVEFNVRIPDGKVDPKLLQKLRAEETGILAWLVEGYRKYKRVGLTPPKAVQAATAEYQASEDRLKEFFDDECAFDVGQTATTANIVKRIVKWCLAQNVRPPSKNELAERLRDLNCISGKVPLDGDTHNLARGWRGIGLLPEAPRPRSGAKVIKLPDTVRDPSRSRPN
jgi:putative DNA primase/helicase